MTLRDLAQQHLDRIHAAGGDLFRQPDLLKWAHRPADEVARLYETDPAPGVLQLLANVLAPWACQWCYGTAQTPDERCDDCVHLLHSRAWRHGRTRWHAVRSPERTVCGAWLEGASAPFGCTIAGQPCRRCVAVLRAEHARSAR